MARQGSAGTGDYKPCHMVLQDRVDTLILQTRKEKLQERKDVSQSLNYSTYEPGS